MAVPEPTRFEVDGPVEQAWDAYEHRPIGRDVEDRPTRQAKRQAGLGWVAAPKNMKVGPSGVVNAQADIEPCACGGEIVVIRRANEDDLTAAIQTHQGTAQHRKWRITNRQAKK